ncbi:DUF2884 family protein [Vibrio hippocampi]|uniref:Chemotaxis protein n=1 Tax=Vibrio hippocampi TaxID=654686 RepID=A0ABN8DIW2_9VIBR|nr:DUF2884 family protein [Vibrio hippocampi]CAH0526710.1 hypothetical protein VHP8226_02082 [Vibrio hippocampi]
MKFVKALSSSTLLLGLALMSSKASALEACRVDIKNEVHLDGQQVEIVGESNSKVLIDKDNNLHINGKKIELDQLQQDALEAYRQNMNKHLPQAKKLAENGLALSHDIIDDVAASFDNSEAFQNVKQVITEFFNDVSSRYQQGDEFVLKSEAFSSFMDNWQQDFAKARESFDKEFFASAFQVMQEKMQQDGSFNLTELQNQWSELQAQLADTYQQQSKQLQQEAKDYCDSLDDVATQEQELQRKIPELKDYQVFTI